MWPLLGYCGSFFYLSSFSISLIIFIFFLFYIYVSVAGNYGLWYYRPMKKTLVIGGGLAGCEASLYLAQAGVPVLLLDMKPDRMSPAHDDGHLGELVCSNSLRSDDPSSAVGLLKAEMTLLGSSVMRAARQTAVDAGKALAVDRRLFAATLDSWVSDHPLIERCCQEITSVPDEGLVILASGPLTTDELAADLMRIAGQDHLHFYDAIAPIVTLDSVDMNHAFWGDRYGQPGVGDYLNCPLTRQEWESFYAALTSSENVPLRDFEKPQFFEGCLPIEVMASRGEKTLLFGPLKPVGLEDPITGKRAHAVVQLRKENSEGTLLNMVGFQTKLTYKSQQQVFRIIPALRNAEFARLGSIHRNTFVDAPRVLDPYSRLNNLPSVFIAGQLSGVEGYVESSASGLLCAMNALRIISGQDPSAPPPDTAHGGLMTHLANNETKHFQPSNINFGLLPPLGGKKLPKKERGKAMARRALVSLSAWLTSLGIKPACEPPII